MIAHDEYQQRVISLDQQIQEGKELSRRLGIARALFAFPGLILLAFAIFSPNAPWGTWQLGGCLMVAFLAVATWQESLQWRIDWNILQCDFYRRMVARCQRDWKNLPPLASESQCSRFESEMTRDLDLFGDRSLFRWLSLAATNSGAAKLADWLTRWEPSTVLTQRQAAVQELQRSRSWRQQFWDFSLAFQGGHTNSETIAAWGLGHSFFQGRRWLRYLTWIGPALAVAGLLGIAIGISSGWTALAAASMTILAPALLLNLFLTITFIGRVHDIFVQIGGANRELQALTDLVRLIEELDASTPLLVQLRSSMSYASGTATVAIQKLRYRMQFAGMQRNALFFLPYLVLQIVLLWDIRILELLERWRAKHGASVTIWIDTLAQLEALTSAAAVADENTDWAYPTWREDRSRNMTFERIAHPLLRASSRVANDLKLEESRPLLLVTGSNMAGKSTLLRSLGINTLLARTGAPVACAAWSAPNCDLASSIRVQDSLQDGVSFFMAELKRLRNVVDFARSQLSEHGIPMMILLDEILQGTNSRERQIAVETVLVQLVELQCSVIASTHDLELANVEALTRIAQIVHFREYFESVDGVETMRFDYIMRPGVTPTTNALKLLELVGLSRGAPIRQAAYSQSESAKKPTPPVDLDI